MVVQSDVSAPLKRGFMALEDGEWKQANNFFEQALNYDAELAIAYVGKLMVDLRIKKQENLGQYYTSFENNKNFQKAMRFADEELAQTLQGYLDSSIKRGRSLKPINAINIILTAINIVSILLMYIPVTFFGGRCDSTYRLTDGLYGMLEHSYLFIPEGCFVIIPCCLAVGYLFFCFWGYNRAIFKTVKMVCQTLLSLILIFLYIGIEFEWIYYDIAGEPAWYILTTWGWLAVATLLMATGLGIIQFFLTKKIKCKEKTN